MTEYRELCFQKCAKGYTLMANHSGPDISVVYAFNDIEGVAAWLVERYTQGSGQ
jgi:hypothetical protein